MNNEIVSVDLGSNSFRVLKYDCLNHKIIAEYNEVVGMADGLVDTGIISDEALQRVVNAINHSIEYIFYFIFRIKLSFFLWLFNFFCFFSDFLNFS